VDYLVGNEKPPTAHLWIFSCASEEEESLYLTIYQTFSLDYPFFCPLLATHTHSNIQFVKVS